MSLIPDDKKELLRADFKEKLVDPVTIVMFTQELECQYCSQTRQLVQELPALNDKISVQILDFVADAAKAKELGVCAAYPDHGHDCAAIAGTLCGGKVQGSFAQKLANCLKCEFHQSNHYDRAPSREALQLRSVSDRELAEIPMD